MPSTRGSFGLPAGHLHSSRSTLPAAHQPVILRRDWDVQVTPWLWLSRCQIHNALHCPLSWMQQVIGGLCTVTIVSRPRDSDSDAVAVAQQEAGPANPAIRFVLTCYITHVEAQKSYIVDFLLYAIIYIVGISHLHYMTSYVIHDIPCMYHTITT